MTDSHGGLPSRLFALAERAAPARSDESHVTPVDIVRVRNGDDAQDLDPAYRHLAGCASCRARLIEPFEASTPMPPAAAVAPLARPPRRQRLRASAAWAALALSLVGVGYAWLAQRAPRELTISRRAYWGMMGSSNPAPGRPADANLELSISPPAPAAAFLVPCSGATCARPSRPYWFTKREFGELTLDLAPRAFRADHESAYGLVVWGDQGPVEQTARELQRHATSAAAERASETEVAAMAGRYGANVQRVQFDP